MEEKITYDAPRVTPPTEEYWTAVSKGEFLVRTCDSCGSVHYYPRRICPHCGSNETRFVKGSGKGRVYTYSVMRRAKIPFVIAYVELEEGPKMVSHIVNCDPEAVQIGQSVVMTFVKTKDEKLSLPVFEPVG